MGAPPMWTIRRGGPRPCGFGLARSTSGHGQVAECGPRPTPDARAAAGRDARARAKTPPRAAEESRSSGATATWREAGAGERAGRLRPREGGFVSPGRWRGLWCSAFGLSVRVRRGSIAFMAYLTPGRKGAYNPNRQESAFPDTATIQQSYYMAAANIVSGTVLPACGTRCVLRFCPRQEGVEKCRQNT